LQALVQQRGCGLKIPKSLHHARLCGIGTANLSTTQWSTTPAPPFCLTKAREEKSKFEVKSKEGPKGAPGLAFETWDPCNRSQMETPPSPLSSRLPRRAVGPERTQISYLTTSQHPRIWLSPKESHRKPNQRHQASQKIWGSEAEGSAVRPCQATKSYRSATFPFVIYRSSVLGRTS
jgi:hypothetical protein